MCKISEQNYKNNVEGTRKHKPELDNIQTQIIIVGYFSLENNIFAQRTAHVVVVLSSV